MLPDLDLLRLLVRVDRLGSIGAAARASGVSQQAASERLRRLEEQTGLVLLVRRPSGTQTTDAGRLLVDWSTDLVERAAHVETALAALRERAQGHLRVHASMTVAESLLPPVLVRLREERDVRVRLHATNTAAVLEAVRAGATDLGFVEGPSDLTGLGSRVVGGDELVVVAHPHDAWARRARPLAADELAARPLTSRESGSGTRATWEAALAAAGQPGCEPSVELHTTTSLLAHVASGGAPGVVSRRSAERDVESGLVVVVPVSGIDLGRPFVAVWGGRDGDRRPEVETLLAVLGEQARRSTRSAGI
ncbi:LysR family transcriptional regulator [Nocardioides acrostichi]|uniref:LysR family transcriptional regulator n=1 Tax=Nocardioides acrostichi TaxID=2784339 RepID=A0A930V0Y8_9ACTN|nr:LysR family transcriptional regulator [Nocardioides acrostichi]MBF4161866.1 LysR family transcriptional regulator [Nocardioides acrostichi]